MQQDKEIHPNQWYFDSHTHLLDFPPAHLQQELEKAKEKGVKFISTNTTHQQQYQKQLEIMHTYALTPTKINNILQLQQQQEKLTIIPSFGLHPCFLQKEKDNLLWEENLQKIVKSNPFFGIGQIGLDFRTATLETNSKQTQTHFFIKQFQMALKLNRVVTVHCVRAFGDLLKHFKHYNKEIEAKTEKEIAEGWKYEGTPIIMHSYGGSKDVTKSLLKLTNLNIFFSLSLKRSEDICTVIPIQKLLLQTDAPFQANLPLLQQQHLVKEQLSEEDKQELRQTNRVEFVRGNISSLCKYYQMERGAFSRVMFENALRVFRILG